MYSYSYNGLDVDRARWLKKKIFPQPLQGLQLLGQFFLDAVWMICCCIGRQWRVTWGRSWGGLTGAPWLCCSWTGLAQLTGLLVFWGRWLLPGLLLRHRTVPRIQRRCVQFLKFFARLCISSHVRTRFVCSRWPFGVSGARRWMGWVPLRQIRSNCLPQKPWIVLRLYRCRLFR